MVLTIMKKELLAFIRSPKFTATFLTCSVLILLSIFIGIQEYKSAMDSYDTASRLVDQKLQEVNNWSGFSTEVYRKPDPLRIFSAGIENDIGRYSTVTAHEEINLKQSSYSDDPLFALFRHLDFVFIVTVLLSLFAIMFTYNSVSGEKENGTLQLTFSHAVSGSQFIIGKILGMWIAIVVPITLPILLGLLLVKAYNIPLSGSHYLLLAILFLMCLLYITFFVAAGIFVSSITKRSLTSFLILLVIWIAFIFIIPRIGIMTAGQLVKVPSSAQLIIMKNAFEREKLQENLSAQEEKWEERSALIEALPEDERDEYRNTHSQEWQNEGLKLRWEMEREVSEYWELLLEQRRNAQRSLREQGFALSFISPSAILNITAMKLAATDVELKEHFEDALLDYRNNIIPFARKKQEELGSSGGLMITIDDERGVSIRDGRNKGTVDLSEIPRMKYSRLSTEDRVAEVIPYAGLLFALTNILLAFSVFFFRKYDLR